MLEYLIERVEKPSDELLKEIADLNAEAFAGEVAWTMSFGGDWSLNTEYSNALVRAAILEGEVYVLKIERGGKMEIASWAAFFPPGVGLFETKAQRNMGFNELFKKFKPELQHWHTETFPKYVADFLDKIFTKEEQKLYWWCNVVATRPDLQCKGFGTALINVGYQRAKKTKELGTFLALVTVTKNINTYIKMKFKEIGEMECPLSDGGQYLTHVMKRKP